MNENNITRPPVTFEVTIGSAYFCLIEEKGRDHIKYEREVIEVNTIKTLGLTRSVAELEVWASGEMFDFIQRTNSADIALTAVALPAGLKNKLEGVEVKDGATVSRTNDIEREFAFGYWSENSDGSLLFFWHPVCKLVPTEETRQTRTSDITDPERNYTVKVIPFERYWKFTYSTSEAQAEGFVPLTINEFFQQPIWKLEQLPEQQHEI